MQTRLYEVGALGRVLLRRIPLLYFFWLPVPVHGYCMKEQQTIGHVAVEDVVF